MKANADRRQGTRTAVIIVATLSLLAVTGCTTEDPGQAFASLLGDLVRQLLTFWIL